ncbi:E1-E2 ATPase-domain-containing protein [Lentinula aciculospora]|uniref:E1-E2 ATPase-domain-containing protein n=1 Tax=Lentinula aciculospora TaxID=153920 RepID=A0A9W9DRZ7_9AGAR|nr:E1-E2 ATPase-domain-containing protein [Lentinula aciculospora]
MSRVVQVDRPSANLDAPVNTDVCDDQYDRVHYITTNTNDARRQAEGTSTEERTQTSESPCCQDESSPCTGEVECSITGSTQTKGPPCCEGKPSPCCDESCLDRIALRECERDDCLQQTICSLNTLRSPLTVYDSCVNAYRRENGKNKACGRHSQTTRAKYITKLEAFECICRVLLALGQESCCVIQKPSAQGKKRSSSITSFSTIDSCCCSHCSSADAITEPRSTKQCISAKVKRINDNCAEDCCGSIEGSAISSEDVDCCGAGEKTNGIQISQGYSLNASPVADLETGRSGTEHISLSISGMTCTGCETKLHRTLAQMESIKNLRTSLVLSRAEFDLDLRTGTLEDVMKRLERATEFKCEKITNLGASIDVITPVVSAIFVKQDWPFGVTSVKSIGKNLARVLYDPKVIGARDLVATGWDTPVKLAPLRADPTLEAGRKHVHHFGYMTLISVVLTIPVLILAWAPLPERDIAYGSASLALATIVQLVIAGPFYTKALKSLVFSKVVEMDLLIVLSTSAAYIFSVVSFTYLVSGHPLSTGEFFETSTLLVTLIMVGRYVAALSRQKAVESISVQSLQTPTALLVDEDGRSESEIDARLLQYGDCFKIVPDSKVPTDGTVISGFSKIDESMITGESKSVEKRSKSAVIAGSINGSGTLIVRLVRLPGENTISTIASMVDEAKLSKPESQEIADRIAGWFVPVVVFLTIITFIVWTAVGVAVQGLSGTEASIQAITYAITVLIISCPCAIGLAVPMVIVITSGVAAERGIIFKSAQSIEVAYKTSHVVFDKTGTLTEGRLAVAAEEYTAENPGATASLLLGLIGNIKHPVSIAVASHLQARTNGIAITTISNIRSVVGKGVEGVSPSGEVLRAGNSRWLDMSSDPRVVSVLSRGLSAFCFTIDGSLNAVFGLADDILRNDALSTVKQLRALGISIHILSGDDDVPVRSVANQLDVPEDYVRAHCTPADKAAYIKALLADAVLSSPSSLLSKPPRPPVVVFCGDGANDAVALAQADIGVHISSSSSLAEVSRSVATIVLVQPRLAGILDALSLSRRATRRIAYNFAWSAVYNIFAITLGAGVFSAAGGGARIPPALAGLGELVSVLPVIAAAVALRWERIEK